MQKDLTSGRVLQRDGIGLTLRRRALVVNRQLDIDVKIIVKIGGWPSYGELMKRRDFLITDKN